MEFSEKKIKETLKDYLKNQEYLVIEEFDVGGIRPDLAAFKWKNKYEIENIAIEAKDSTSTAKIKEALSQLMNYQIYFSQVYLAVPLPKDQKKEQIINMMKLFNIGVYFVDNEGRIILGNMPKRDNIRINLKKHTPFVRQRGVAALIFRELIPNAEMHYTSDEKDFYIWSGKDINYEIFFEEFLWESHIAFGLTIQGGRGLSKVKKIKENTFLKYIQMLTEYYITFYKYASPYRQGSVYLETVMHKKIEDISEKDLKFMFKLIRERDGYNILISKPVWKLTEILSREEHKIRVRAVKKELDGAYNYLTSL